MLLITGRGFRPVLKQYVCSPAEVPYRKASRGKALDQSDCEMSYGIHNTEFFGVVRSRNWHLNFLS